MGEQRTFWKNNKDFTENIVTEGEIGDFINIGLKSGGLLKNRGF